MVGGYSLDQTFAHNTKTHEYHIRWTRIGKTTAPALVLIHGTPWSSAVWQSLVTSLATHYNIFLYDHSGFGASPAHRRLSGVADHGNIDLDPSLTLRAEVSAALFKHWDMANPPHVVAHDNGGLVSLRLLLQHDIKFASLCLIDVVALGPFGLPFFKLVAENESVFAAVPPRLTEGLVRAYVRSAAFKPVPEGVEDMLSAQWLVDGNQGCGQFLNQMVQAHFRNTNGLEREYDRTGSQSPMKIIWGKEDAWVPAETAPRLQKALKADEIVIVEEAGHLIHYDQPGRLALEVGLWLDKHSRH